MKLKALGTLLLLAGVTAYAGGGRNRVCGDELAIELAKVPVSVDGKLDEWDQSHAKFLSLAQPGNCGEGKGAFDDLNAKLAFSYDDAGLNVAVWWNDPTPLGPELSDNMEPPGDGLVLTFPRREIRRMAFWRDPATGKPRAVRSPGVEMQGVVQAFQITGKNSYTQEIRVPWAELGGKLAPGERSRVGVELCFGGLDPAASYKVWRRDQERNPLASGNRFGGGMCWGFMDGLASPDQLCPTYNPATGAEVKLMPAGTVAPANPAVMWQGNEQTRTGKMLAVPARTITLDGRLDPAEWDAKTATTIAYEPTLFPGRYAVDVHWAYGADGLYAGLRWHTGGPHLNINDPKIQGNGYDGGDAMQLRLGTDKVSHIDAWWHDASKTPAVAIVYGVGFNEGAEKDALAKGAKLALQPSEGGGYTEELFLPWALITKTGAPLKEGDSFRVVFDVFFSGLEGNRLPFIVNTKTAQSGGVVQLPFTALKDSFCTAVVEREGCVVRHLAWCEKLRGGQRLGQWDGLDDDGKVVEPGTYQLRGLWHQGVGLKYLTTYNNPGQPSWQNDDGGGEWGGDHSPPQAVTTDSDGVYLGWPAAEDGCGIIGCGFDGKKRWGFFQTPYPAGSGAACLASDGQFLYYAADAITQLGNSETAKFKTVVTCLDRATGFRRGFSKDQPYHELASGDTSQARTAWAWDLRETMDYSLDSHGIHDDYYYTGRCAGANLGGLAAKDGKLYASLRLPGEIAVFAAKDMAPLARWKLSKPGGLAFAPDGRLLAVSDKSVVALDTKTGAATPLITEGLTAPVGLAVGPDGTLYVSDWGAAQCVKVFDRSGKFLRTIGKPGGRAWIGAYDQNGMLLPRGVALDKLGQLWVAEDDNQPRRVSVWDAASGKFLREFVGGTIYGAVCGGMLDPRDPGRAISAGVWFGLDLSKEGYTPLSTIFRRNSRDQYFTFGPACGSNATPGTRFLDFNGRRFIVCSDTHRVVVGELFQDGSWKPLVAAGGIFARGDELLPDNKLRWNMQPAPEFFRKHGGENYIWTDANGDGAAQEGEMQFRKQEKGSFPCWSAYWGCGALDPQMNIYIGGEGAACKFPLQGWDANGLPRYDIDKSEVVARPEGLYDGLGVDKRGRVYTGCTADARGWGMKTTALIGYGQDGNPLWRIQTQKDYRPMSNLGGEGLMGPVDVGGEVGEVVSLSQWHGCYVPLVTTDGLLVGRLLRDPAEGGAPGPDMYRGETIQYFNRLDDGRVILAHGKNAHHLFQVTGLDTVKRFAAPFTLSPAQATLAAERKAAMEQTQQALVPVRIVPSQAAVKVDGDLGDWDWSTASRIGRASGLPRAEVALRLVDKELCVAFKVFKAGPFLNTGKDDAAQLFLTGDAVDLQFSSDPAANPERKIPALGDCRLVFSKLDGKPVATLYQAQVPNAKKPVAFSSPTRSVVFDAVGIVPGAKVAVKDVEGGYVVEASVPAELLGGLWPGRVVQGDVGIIVADKTGRRVARVYRYNQDTGIVSDVPTEAALTPANWGRLQVDKLK